MTEIKNPTVVDYTDVSDDEMNEMIDDTLVELDDGDLVNGVIVKIEHDEVLVDVGFKSEGVIPARELSIRKDADPSDIVNVGDKIEALVLQKEDKDGRLILSKKRAEYERAWINIEEKFKAGEVVKGEVIEVVKGGLILDIGLRGFLPASLVDLRRVKDLDMYLNTEIEARVIEMDRNRNNVVLSRRVLLEEGRKNERAEILAKLSKGMRLKGKVSSIVDFGAFVDLGGIDGLVHISELSWSHVTHPSEVVSVGDEVEVEVLDVDAQRERISLGLKQTTEDPWIKLVESYPLGTIVDGKVTKLVPFGAFVELDDAIEGLVHISEMASRHIDAPAQVVKVGMDVKVKVMDVSFERRRISLSMKAAADELGFDIVVDESVQVDEKAPRQRTRKSDKDGQTEDADSREDVKDEASAEPAEKGTDSDADASVQERVDDADKTSESAGASEKSPAEEAAVEKDAVAPAEEAGVEEEAAVEEPSSEQAEEHAAPAEEAASEESEEPAAPPAEEAASADAADAPDTGSVADGSVGGEIESSEESDAEASAEEAAEEAAPDEDASQDDVATASSEEESSAE